LAIRLKDIAADVGVSTITVSKVLRNKRDVGEETRRRVLQRVKELNYRPNLLARGLASGKSQTIGLIVPDLVHTFFAEFAKGLKAGLRSRGYQLILASAEEEPELEREEIQNLLARGVDALLVASCQVSAEGFEAIVDSGIPYVLIDRMLPDLPSHFVGTDDVRAGLLATEHLISLGRKRIAHLAGKGVSTGVERFKGYQDALAAARIAFQPSLVIGSSRLEESGDQIGRSAMEQLLALKRRPDAVFCYNDLTAVGAIGCILNADLRVPEDIAVIGCGNLRLATYLEVPLSSVDQSTLEQGEQAAKLTVSLLSGAQRPGLREILIDPRVIARASTIGKISKILR
jgi:LacI family transcriptional regulator